MYDSPRVFEAGLLKGGAAPAGDVVELRDYEKVSNNEQVVMATTTAYTG